MGVNERVDSRLIQTRKSLTRLNAQTPPSRSNSSSIPHRDKSFFHREKHPDSPSLEHPERLWLNRHRHSHLEQQPLAWPDLDVVEFENACFLHSQLHRSDIRGFVLCKSRISWLGLCHWMFSAITRERLNVPRTTNTVRPSRDTPRFALQGTAFCGPFRFRIRLS